MCFKVMRLISYWIGLNASRLLTVQDTIFVKQSIVNLSSIPNYKDVRFFLSSYSTCLLNTFDSDMASNTDLTLCL